MKATFTTIIISFFLLFSNSSFGQDYLIVFTRPKGNGGCGDMRYQKIELKNKDDYWKQSEALQKQYTKEAYKDHYVSAQEYAVVMESTGQYTNISCKFKKYEFFRSKKSLEEARKKAQEQYTKFGGMYANPPKEVSVFSPDLIKADHTKTEKKLGDVDARFFPQQKKTKKKRC